MNDNEDVWISGGLVFHLSTHTHTVPRSGCSHLCVTLAEQQVVVQMETGITLHTRIWNLLVPHTERWLVAPHHAHTQSC